MGESECFNCKWSVSLKVSIKYSSALERPPATGPICPGVHDEMLPGGEGRRADEEGPWTLQPHRATAGMCACMSGCVHACMNKSHEIWQHMERDT